MLILSQTAVSRFRVQQLQNQAMDPLQEGLPMTDERRCGCVHLPRVRETVTASAFILLSLFSLDMAVNANDDIRKTTNIKDSK
jgi:hypothetical protein